MNCSSFRGKLNAARSVPIIIGNRRAQCYKEDFGERGKFLGAYNAYSVNEQYKSGQISKGRMQIEQASNLFSRFGRIYGASWGVGWELGKLYGPSKWYGNDDTKWFE